MQEVQKSLSTKRSFPPRGLLEKARTKREKLGLKGKGTEQEGGGVASD